MNELLKDFENTILATEKRLREITEEQSEIRPSVNKWSKKEILGHLIDSAFNNTIRFVTGQVKTDFVFPGYDQNFWVDVQKYQDRNWFQLIDLWKFSNLHIWDIVKQIPEEVLLKQFYKHNLDEIAWKVVNRYKPVNLEYLILDYIGHLKHHLNQIYNK
jgi:hypothetical protein